MILGLHAPCKRQKVKIRKKEALTASRKGFFFLLLFAKIIAKVGCLFKKAKESFVTTVENRTMW